MSELHVNIDAGTAAHELSRIASGLSRAVFVGIDDQAGMLTSAAKANTPHGPGPRPGDLLGHIGDSYSTTRMGGTLALVSSHPGAIVHEFGGTIAPRGAPIQIKESAMARSAAHQNMGLIEESVQQRIDTLVR